MVCTFAGSFRIIFLRGQRQKTLEVVENSAVAPGCASGSFPLLTRAHSVVFARPMPIVSD